MKFIEFKSKTGMPLALNAAKINAFASLDSGRPGSMLSVGGELYEVQETYAEIKQLLDMTKGASDVRP